MNAALQVAFGAIIGSAARYGVGTLVPVESGSLPWATLVVNTLGALLLGAVFGLVSYRPRLVGSPLTFFVGQGVLGSFTTFSAFAVEADLLVSDGEPTLALLYVLATLAVGLAATRAGVALGMRRA
ncbi:MAG: fluoride efflux transporter FluC [Acidimicrobiales bacterium]